MTDETDMALPEELVKIMASNDVESRAQSSLLRNLGTNRWDVALSRVLELLDHEKLRDLARMQVDLPADAQRVLDENRWDLYGGGKDDEPVTEEDLRAADEGLAAYKSGEFTSSDRLKREERLRGLGYDEPTDDERRDNMARSVALMSTYPRVTVDMVEALAKIRKELNESGDRVTAMLDEIGIRDD